MYGGSYRNNGDGFSNQGVGGAYWSSTQHPSDTINAWAMYLYSNTTYPGTGTGDKAGALTVRYVKDMPAQTGDDIQTITAANCPVDRTRARDARDGATYWVRKIGSLCWMETNLAYAGGGTNTYGDATSAITQGSSSADLTDTEARYFVPTGSNRTTGTTDPSTSTNGTGQYGYLYNWCAAMNSQSAACQITSSDQPNQSVNSGTASTLYNICPLNWRLPAGGSGGEFAALNSAINSGSTSSWSRLLTQGLFMYSGVWSDDFKFQGSTGYYWSSTAYPSRATHAYTLNFGASGVYPAISVTKRSGFAVRCVAP
jgi:uncharacterized protein (TIGR02145 family)